MSAPRQAGSAAATPIGRGVVQLGIVLLVAFAVLATTAGYWQVVRSRPTSSVDRTIPC